MSALEALTANEQRLVRALQLERVTHSRWDVFCGYCAMSRSVCWSLGTCVTHCRWGVCKLWYAAHDVGQVVRWSLVLFSGIKDVCMLTAVIC